MQTRPLSAPLAELSAGQLNDFLQGAAEFSKIETAQSGLGPIFNNVSCVSCHFVGGIGGAGPQKVTRFGRSVDGHFDPMDAQGGSLLQQRAIAPEAREVIPPEANAVAQRQTTALFGAGLIEAIPDATLIANAARSMPDGISGRAAVTVDPVSGTERIGRFGWKAQQATLLAFSGDAYLNEMGITNRVFPKENAPNGNITLLEKYDRVADIEDVPVLPGGKSDIDAAADFMRFLAPPAPLPQGPVAQIGAKVFETIGCANCHTPVLTTGSSSIAGLSNKTVRLYSDLLLHDMGSLGDGIAQGAAQEKEMRTAPLWGLRVRGAYLHDGRAATIDQAITAHDGEAQVVVGRYQSLTPEQRQALLSFLGTL